MIKVKSGGADSAQLVISQLQVELVITAPHANLPIASFLALVRGYLRQSTISSLTNLVLVLRYPVPDAT